MGLIPGSGRASGEGNGNPLQYSCLENLLKRGAWWVTVHRAAKSQTQLKRLSMHTTFFMVQLPHENIARSLQSATRKKTLTTARPDWHPDLRLPAPRTMRSVCVCVCVCVCVYKNDIVNRFGYGSLGGLRYFPLQDPNGQMEIYQRFAEEIFLQNRNKARPQEVSLWRQEYRADV